MITSYTMAFPALFPQNRSRMYASMVSYLFPGALEPLATVSVTNASMAFNPIAYPQNRTRLYRSNINFVFPGAVQPAPTTPPVDLSGVGDMMYRPRHRRGWT